MKTIPLKSEPAAGKAKLESDGTEGALRATGESPEVWASNCPGTNHFLYISTKTDTFGCGWCKRKGDAEELRKFTVERSSK